MKKMTILFWSSLLVVAIIFSSFFIGNVNGSKKEETFTIGVLTANEKRLVKIDGMMEGLKQYGFNDKNIILRKKNAYRDLEKLQDLGQELVDEGVDVIVTTGSHETLAMKNMGEDIGIPVVFIGVGCTVENGIVEGYMSTGGNITGVDSHNVQLSGKKLEFFKKLIPDAQKMLVLYNSETTPYGGNYSFLCEAAKKLNIELEIVDINTREELYDSLENQACTTDGLMLMCSLLFEEETENIANIGQEMQIPIMGINQGQVEKGILAFYGGTGYDEGVQSARMVANILRGQNPRKIPIESPEVLEFYLNIETSKLLGIDIEKGGFPFVDNFVYTKGW